MPYCFFMSKASQKLKKFFINFRKNIHIRFSPVINIEIDKIISSNRKDIEVRVDFLSDVIGNNKNPKETLYYRFISDKRRLRNPKALELDGDYMVKKFLDLFNKIDREGFDGSILIDSVKDREVNTHYLVEGKKKFVKVKNTNGYQLLKGAHRIAIQKYLGEIKIPCRVLPGSKTSYSNYSIFINDIMNT